MKIKTKIARQPAKSSAPPPKRQSGPFNSRQASRSTDEPSHPPRQASKAPVKRSTPPAKHPIAPARRSLVPAKRSSAPARRSRASARGSTPPAKRPKQLRSVQSAREASKAPARGSKSPANGSESRILALACLGRTTHACPVPLPPPSTIRARPPSKP